MSAPTNRFKKAIAARSTQIGLWLGLTSPVTAEIAAGAGFDWVLIDGEHAPNDLPLMLEQLRALSSHSAHAIVRPPIGETWLIKQILDIGAQTLLIPMVESAEQARQLARAMRYPPDGVRGVGAALARASAYSRTDAYIQTANREMCLLVQAESRKAIEAVAEIAAVEGVDGVFIGPADLAADMGYPGNSSHPEVLAAIDAALDTIHAAGKASGILVLDEALSAAYVEKGVTFVAVGTDVTLFAAATSALAARFGRSKERSGNTASY